MTNDRDLDLVTDDPHPAVEAAGWFALAAGVSLGLALTAGWAVRTAWNIAGDAQARHFLGLP